MWSIKGEICTVKDTNRINKIRNRLGVLDVIRSFGMTYSSKSIQSPICAKKLSHVLSMPVNSTPTSHYYLFAQMYSRLAVNSKTLSYILLYV